MDIKQAIDFLLIGEASYYTESAEIAALIIDLSNKKDRQRKKTVCGDCKHIIQSLTNVCYCGKIKPDEWGNYRDIENVDIRQEWCPLDKRVERI